MLEEGDEELRGILTRAVARLGRAPSLAVLAREAKRSEGAVEASLRRLHDGHALLLHPGSARPWVVHPFALAPGSCWVATEQMGYWANCLYCAFGIAASLGTNAEITTRYGGEAETVRYTIKDHALLKTDGIFHLSTPVAQWWDNVLFACASFQPFRNEIEAREWCDRHDLPLGAVLSLQQLWTFANDWYGSYLASPWKKRSREEITEIFSRNGLTGPFWSV